MKNAFCSIIAVFAVIGFLNGQTITSYKDTGGIMFEEFDTVPDQFAYSLDNVIYIPNKKFKCVYQYVKNGDNYCFQSIGEKNWKLIEKSLATDSVAQTIVFEILNNTSMYPNLPLGNEGQSRLHFSYFNAMQRRLPIQGFTGLVENEKNIWMHPPREFLFQVLELNPFPYIKFPVVKGRKWRWQLTIGPQWGNPLWKEWDGDIVNKYKYRIIDTDYKLQTAFGELSCAVVKAFARSRIGATEATFFFHKTYGFVRFEYVNIDDSTIILDLIEVSE